MEIDAAVAQNYDELPLWSAPFGQLILERVPLRRGQRIVDIGAGTGFLTIELAQRSAAQVIAVDPWADAMAVLRRKLDHLGLTDVELLVSDAADLAIPTVRSTSWSPTWASTTSRTPPPYWPNATAYCDRVVAC